MHAEFVLKLFRTFRNDAAIDTRGFSVLFVSTLQSQLERCICFKSDLLLTPKSYPQEEVLHVNAGVCI